MRICIVGAGLTGLMSGYRLSEHGHKVTILEKESQTGGLLSSFTRGDDAIPQSYHHIMKFDDATRKLIKELGLMERYFQKRTKMGFFYKNRVHKLSTPSDVLSFKPLSISGRIKFALFGLKVLKVNDWEKLEGVTAEEWITKEANAEIYEKMFKPLLKIKFGNDYNKITARWVGERLKLGESSGPFGYLEGGLQQILDKMEFKIKEFGSSIETCADVMEFKTRNNKIVSVKYRNNGKTKEIETDHVIYTGPAPLLSGFAKFPEEYEKKLNSIKYKSTICAVIGLDAKLSDYYWINFIDGGFSFGGVITHSALNHTIKSAKSVIYVFTYLDQEDELWKMEKNEVLGKYLSELGGVFPNIKNHVLWKELFKIRYSKPVYYANYGKYALGNKTPIENLHLGGIATFYPKIRNMGTAIETGEELAALIEKEPAES